LDVSGYLYLNPAGTDCSGRTPRCHRIGWQAAYLFAKLVPGSEGNAETAIRQGFATFHGEFNETLMERSGRSFFRHLFQRLSQKSTSAQEPVDEKKPGEPGFEGTTIKPCQKA